VARFGRRSQIMRNRTFRSVLLMGVLVAFATLAAADARVERRDRSLPAG